MRLKKVASSFVLALIAVPMILAFQNCGQGFEGVQLASNGEAQFDDGARLDSSQAFSTNFTVNLTVVGGGTSRVISRAFRDSANQQASFFLDLNGQFRDQCFLIAADLKLQPPQTLSCTVSGYASVGRQTTQLEGYVFGRMRDTAIGIVWDADISTLRFGPVGAAVNPYGDTYGTPAPTPVPVVATPPPVVSTPVPTPMPTAPPAAPSCPSGATYYTSDYDLGCGGKGSCWSQGPFSGGVYGASRQYSTWYASCPIGVVNTNPIPVYTPAPTPMPTPVPTPRPTATPVPTPRPTATPAPVITPTTPIIAPFVPTPTPVQNVNTSGYPACPSTIQGLALNASITCYCSDTSSGNVWGTDIYTDDSNLCRAAAHSSLIGAAGGVVTAVKLAGLNSYSASYRNGIQSNSYGAWQASLGFGPLGVPMTPIIAPFVPTPTPYVPQATPVPTPAPVTTAMCPENATGLAIGTQITCTCPAQVGGNAWGTGYYTDDSTICLAAAHSGFRQTKILVTVTAGRSSYTGSTLNGITTYGYGAWPKSYTVGGALY